MDQRPQQCFLVPLIAGTDGVQKMSKSLGNYISISDSPDDMYGKTMSLPDNMTLTYMDYLTDVPNKELDEMHRDTDGGSVNPMELKKRLARELVTQFHDYKSALVAEHRFESMVQRGETPDDINTFEASKIRGRMADFLIDAKLARSAGEAKRLINQNAVHNNDEPIRSNLDARTSLTTGDVVRVGRRRYVRVT